MQKVKRDYESFTKGEYNPNKEVKKERNLNPNPITYTTKMLMCRYHEDNLNKGMNEEESIKDIARDLCREEAVVKKILAKCMADGNYELFNRWGKSYLEVRGSI